MSAPKEHRWLHGPFTDTWEEEEGVLGNYFGAERRVVRHVKGYRCHVCKKRWEVDLNYPMHKEDGRPPALPVSSKGREHSKLHRSKDAHTFVRGALGRFIEKCGST